MFWLGKYCNFFNVINNTKDIKYLLEIDMVDLSIFKDKYEHKAFEYDYYFGKDDLCRAHRENFL